MNRPRRKPEHHVLPELTEYIFRQFPVALYTSLVLSALVVAALWGLFPRAILLSWLTAVYVLCMLRFLLYHWHRLVPEGPFTIRQWLRFYSLGAALSGVVWGVMPLLFYSDDSPQTNLFIAFVIGGLVSGASSSMAPLKKTLRAFTILTCLPIALLFIFRGDRLHLIMGTMMLIFGGAYLLISVNTARMMIESFILRKENLHEIEERRKAEAELRMIQQGLEETVTLRTMELRTANEELSKEIDERLQVESKLRVSEERYRSLVESSSDWIWEMDRDGRYTYASPSVFSMLGYTQHEVPGQMLYDFMPPEEAERVKAIFSANAADRKAIEGLVTRCLHKNATEHIIETNGEPVFEIGGAFTGYRGIHRDITHRVRHEEEQRKVEHLESLGLLAGGIAHDFNNLLMAILGNIELSRISIAADSEAGRPLADAIGAMSQARKLTEQLLTFSRGGSPILAATSVRDLILDSCRFALSGTDVKCEYDIPDDLWMANIDSGQIWQVLNNILTNAREAMPGGGTLWVRAENVTVKEDSMPALAPGRFVRVSVRDQGSGISRENIPRVFDPYFSTKVRGSTKGTGIGLAVCYSIIEKHGGQILLASEPGCGTTVTFLLKAIDGEPENAV